MKKRIISVVLSCIMLLSLSFGVSAKDAQTQESNEDLKFGSDGKFKILVLADVQDDYPINDDTMAYINEALDAEKPDLVVFDGDNIVTSDVRAYEQLLSPLVERNVKFTFVFGNHDDESSDLNPEQMLAEYQKYPGCLAYDADPEMHGCATHNLPIMSSDGSKIAFNLWMFDSGDYVYYQDGTKGYDCVRYSQIEWYKKVSKQLEAETGALVPSIAFQHIIPQEGVEQIFAKSLLNLGDLTFNFTDGSKYTYFPICSRFHDGFVFEKSCPSFDNEGEWDAFVERGDVLSLFIGHDHVNSFRTTCKGVDLVQVPGITSNSYSKLFIKGAEVITLDEKNPKSYESHVLYAFDLALRDGSALPGLNSISKAQYFGAKVLNKVCFAGLALGKFFTAIFA